MEFRLKIYLFGEIAELSTSEGRPEVNNGSYAKRMAAIFMSDHLLLDYAIKNGG